MNRGAPRERILSISTAAFDGYDLPVAFEEIARLGVAHIEPAFIQGYTEEFGEDIFSASSARRLQAMTASAKVSCFSLSAHMNLTVPKTVEIFKRRMEFARILGAKIIVTNAGLKKDEKVFFKNMEALAREGEILDLIIGLENPGDGRENLVNTGEDGASLIRSLGSQWVRMNYDFGNLLSHRFEKVRPEEDYLHALPVSAHLHLKDVKKLADGWGFTEIGKGAIDYAGILKALAGNPAFLPVSLEIPLRFTRGPDALPRRGAAAVPLEEIRRVLHGSVEFVKKHMGI